MKPPKVLIAEDEIAIALEIELTVQDAGFVPVGPAGNLEEYTALSRQQDIAAAILDVGLLGRAPEQALAPLIERQVPLLLLSGYEDIDGLACAPLSVAIQKPVHMPDLVDRLHGLLAR